MPHAASNLAAGGNASLSAGEQVNVYASKLSAGQTLDITGREVNIYSGVNQHEASNGTRQSNTGLGATALVGHTGTTMHASTMQTNRVEQTTLAAATLSGNQVNVTATGGDVTLVGARIHAG